MRLERLAEIPAIPDVPNNTPLYTQRKTPPGMPVLHMLACILGSRGAGKTTTMVRFLKMYVQSKSYDHILWISPTAKRDDKVQAFATFAEKHGTKLTMKDDFIEHEFVEHMEYMKTEIDAYRKYVADIEVWRKFVRVKDESKLTFEDLMALHGMGWEEPKTEYKHGPPSFAIVFDDCAGKKSVFTPTVKGTVGSFAIAHRHYSCSAFFLLQSHATGLPRQLRANVSLWILFASKSATLKKAIAEEIAWRLEPEQLLAAWDFATKDSQYACLFLDYDNPDVSKSLRKGFDQIIRFDAPPNPQSLES